MLKKEEILQRTGKGLDVFRHYLKGEWRVGRNFLNPFYEDTRASCNVYFDRGADCYRMKDFGNDKYTGDCFFLVGKLNNLDCGRADDFVEILKTINRDMVLGLGESNSRSACVNTRVVKSSGASGTAANLPKLPGQATAMPRTDNSYTAVRKPFSTKELEYWSDYDITSAILNSYKVVSLKEFSGKNREGAAFTFRSSEQEPIFGYQGKHHIKIYRPFSRMRFLYGGSLPENHCFGLSQLPAKGDTLFITGGEKDVLSLAAHGFHAISFNSETSGIPHGIIRKLSYRFKHIVILYDTDKTGLESSLRQQQQLSEFGVKRLVLPLPGCKADKDISDYFKGGKTRRDFMQLFIDFLDSLYSETMAILKPCEIDFGNPPKGAETIVSINDVPLGTQGNLFGITGGEGTGKSNYAGSLISGAIRNAETPADLLGTTVLPDNTGKAVLMYDTEQSELQLYKNISNILRRGGIDRMPDYFKAYCLTGMSRKERLQAIVQSMDRYYYRYGGIHMVVIDGIADLVRCANDEGESVGTIDELYRLAGIYNTCIVCVLHFIPNGMKLRGHLGSELQRKAAAIVSIERDDSPEVSVIKALKVRDGSPLDVPLLQFAWDKEKGMHTCTGEKPKEEKDKRKETELISVGRAIFDEKPHITYSELCTLIQSHLDVKERTAKSYIRFMRDKDIILKDPSCDNYFIIGHI